MPSSDSVVQRSALKRIALARGTRITAAGVVVGLAAGAIVTAGGGTAGAATPTRAQSVGRFLDGSAGGMSLQSLVDLKDARAKAAPTTRKRQGINATLFNAGDIPIGDGLKLPGGGVFNLGAANQIAVAKTSGYSYGASGAVENNGGAQLTDNNGQYPADATINLSGAALGKVSIPGLPTSIPGLPSGTGGAIPSVASLGGVVGKIGAVQALAQTKAGGGNVRPQSSLADLQLSLGSPALGMLLSQLDAAFKTDIVGGLTTAAKGTPLAAALNLLTQNVKGCSLLAPTSTNVSLEGGGVVIMPAQATITVDLKILLKRLLGIDISHLKTSNFDLVKFLVQKLPTILSTGLERVVNGLTKSLESQFAACSDALVTALNGLGLPVPIPSSTLTGALNSLQGMIEDGIGSVSGQLISAGSGGLATLADGLTGAVDIGLNVQSGPKIQPHDTRYKYTTQLKKTPDQATAVVKHQSLVRAVEIDLLDASSSVGTGSGLPTSLPGVPGTNAVASHQLAGARRAAAGSSAVSLALGNAAAGPSVAAPTVTTTTSTPTGTPATGTSIPTGVPAGAAGHSGGGSPLLPAALLLLGLVVAGGGVLSFRMRGRSAR